MVKEQIQRMATHYFVRYGIKRVKMDHIARQLHISKKTIYDHFGSKNQLFDCCVQGLITQDRIQIQDIVETEPSVITAIIEINAIMLKQMVASCPTFIHDLKEYDEGLRMASENYRMFVEQVYTHLLRLGIEGGLFVPDTDCLLIPKLFDALLELIYSDERQPCDEGYARLYRFTVFTLLAGFCTEYGRKELSAFSSDDIKISNINL